MLSLEEAQLQGGRTPPPTLLGCFVLLMYYRPSFLCNHHDVPVKPKCSKEWLPSGGQIAYYRMAMDLPL